MNSGLLQTESTAELLRSYARRAATGCLRLEHAEMQARVYFRNGLVYTATAPGARARLGDRLVGAGHISEAELAATLEHQQSLLEARRIGELLIEQGLIDRETMRAFVREQSTDSVAVAMGWQTGTWLFADGEEVPEDVPLDMSVENLLMEGSRRLEEWEVIQARIGSLDAIVDFVPAGDAAELALTPDEWAMLTRIDGQSSIAEIAEASGYSEFEAGRIIFGLLTAGVVSLVDDGDEDVEGGDGEMPEAGTEQAFTDPAAETLADQPDHDEGLRYDEPPDAWPAHPAHDEDAADEAQPDAWPAHPAHDEGSAPGEQPYGSAPTYGGPTGPAHERPDRPDDEPEHAGEERAQDEPAHPAAEHAGHEPAHPAAEHEHADDDSASRPAPTEEHYDPVSASHLFGELGFDDAGAPADPPTSEPPPDTGPPDDKAPDAGDAPGRSGEAAPGDEAEEPRPRPTVNRNELLREFAALDEPDPGADEPPRPAPPPRTPPPSRDDERDKDDKDDRDKRRGLFGRLRRE